MSYELINKDKKFQRTKGWIESMLLHHKDSANTMLDVIKSDGQNKLSTERVPSLEEWKSVYINMGWKYLENEQLCYSDTLVELESPFSDNNNKNSYNPTSNYGEVELNYETYFSCRRQVHLTQLMLKELEVNFHNQNLLDFDSINHDEALCFLLGINANIPNILTMSDRRLVSVFDYEDDYFDDSINGLLSKSKEHQLLKRKFGTPTINIKEFTDWAIDKKYIRLTQKKHTHIKTVARDKKIAIVKKSLIEYLPTIEKNTTKHNLSLNKAFHSILQENGLKVEEPGIDANEIKSKKYTHATSTSIDNYIEEILLSEWWNDDLETSRIRIKIRKPTRNKAKNN